MENDAAQVESIASAEHGLTATVARTKRGDAVQEVRV